MPTFLNSGGTVYGPFPGEITLGSAANNTLLVADGPPLQARVVPRPNGWVLHPTGAPLTLTRRTARNTPVTGPVQMSQGDSFTLGPNGPTFVVGATADVAAAGAPPAIAAPPPQARSGPRPGQPARPSLPRPSAAGRPSGPRRGLPTGGDLAEEAIRQAEVHAMRIGPVQQVRQAMFRYQSGTFFQPRYIIGALFAFGGTAFMSCSAVAAWIWAQM